MTVNSPMRFPGTAAEAEKNRQSHRFYGDRCSDCDCRPWGRYAEWPCGASVPRVEEGPEAVAEFTFGFAAYSAVKES